MSPSMSEPLTLRSGVELRGPLRQWARLGRRVIRQATSRRIAWTVFIDSDGVVAWPNAAGAAPSRHDSFEAWALANRDSSALLVVSGRLLHTLRLGEVATAGNIDRLRLVAAQRFALYHGGSAAAWPIAVGCGSGFACALHGIALASIVDIAATHGIDLAGMVPLWSEAIARAVGLVPVLRTSGVAKLLLVEHGLVTCMYVAAGDLIDVQQRLIDEATPAALDDLADRLAVESGLPALEVTIAGWGIVGVVSSTTRIVLGSLGGGPEDAAWLFAAHGRAQG